MKKKKIILCADDYGMNDEISQGILDLVSCGRLSALSCMTSTFYWKDHASRLYPFKEKVLVGLHLNLTEGTLFYEKPSSVSSLILKSHLGILNKELVKKELFAQAEAFIDHYKKAPDFIDGHQHIHHLPYVREIVSEIYYKYMGKGFVRSVASYSNLNLRLFAKTLILNLTGAKNLTLLLKKKGIPFNSTFLGVRSFSEKDFSAFMKETLKRSQNNSLIMCHPALKLSSKTTKDEIKQARVLEYEYFKSNLFLEDLNEEKVHLCDSISQEFYS